MLVKEFIKKIKEEYAKVGKVSNDGKAFSGRRDVPVEKLPPRLNVDVKDEEIGKPEMGGHKNQKPTANVGNVKNDGKAFSGRREVPVKKVHESDDVWSLSPVTADA